MSFSGGYYNEGEIRDKKKKTPADAKIVGFQRVQTSSSAKKRKKDQEWEIKAKKTLLILFYKNVAV